MPAKVKLCELPTASDLKCFMIFCDIKILEIEICTLYFVKKNFEKCGESMKRGSVACITLSGCLN